MIDLNALLSHNYPPSPDSPALAQLEAFAEGYTAAWCSQNAASMAAFFAPGVGSLAPTQNLGFTRILRLSQ
ncbi:MAG: hypothetical protein IVW51_10400 [Thermaceae bacterium]|nr:hypothetical protein [Thermaceae bacterium]